MQMGKRPKYAPGDIDTIINSIKDGITVTNVDSKIILLNTSSALLKGDSYENLFGKTIFELISSGIMLKPGKHEFAAIVDNIIAGQTAKFEMQIKGSDNVFAVVGYPIYKRCESVYRILYTSNDKFSRLNGKSNGYTKIAVRPSFEPTPFQTDSDINIFSYSDTMKPVISLANKVAAVDSPVFLTGETGVGKGLLAQYIHNISPRESEPFIQVNCAAIPDNLFESEVFGYEEGAFTGANRQGKLGLMELAKEGTLFLDEITELSPFLQAKLLQVMQEGVFWRLGGSAPIQLKARIISATNQNILELVKNKSFREDLYYRMCVVPIEIPPLRERWEDTLLLAEGFLNQFNEKYRTNKYFSPEVLIWMNQYKWPGNVRELRNVIEQMAIISEGNEIVLEDVPWLLRTEHHERNNFRNMSLKEANEKLEKALIQKVLGETNNNKEAAAVLGISQSTLLRRINKYGLKGKAL